MERQEKNKALSDYQKIIRERDQAIHSYEQLKKEHIGLRKNIERMYSQFQAQQQVRYNDSPCHQLYSQVLSYLCLAIVWTVKNYIVHVQWEILLQVHYPILDTQKRINIVKTYTVVTLTGDASDSTFCCV